MAHAERPVKRATSLESAIAQLMSIVNAVGSYARRAKMYQEKDLDALIEFLSDPEVDRRDEETRQWAIELTKAVRDFRRRVIAIEERFGQ